MYNRSGDNMGIKMIISLLVIIFSLIVVLFIQRKYKLTKNQIVIFLLLTLFWISVGLIRDYRKRYAIIEISKGGLGLGALVASNIAAGYGLISMIVRLPIFYFSDLFKRRKIFIQIALFLLMITSLLVYTNPNQTTLHFSSLAMGFSASLLALFNVVFASTFEKEKAMISVSILSIAPLIAEFTSSALQYYILAQQPNYGYLWLISSIIAAISFVLVFFMPEFKYDGKQFTKEKFLKIMRNPYFIVVCISAVLISFIRFSTSGANLNAYVKILNMDEFYISYIDVVFSIAQLISGVLMGLVLQKKFGTNRTLHIGLFSSLLYVLLLIFTKNTHILFFAYVLHGLGYGICYNCLIGMALQPFEKEERYLTMGIFQAFFAIGIYYGDKVYALLIDIIPIHFNSNTTVFIFVSGLILITMILVGVVKYEKD